MPSSFAIAAGLQAHERLGPEFRDHFNALFADPAANEQPIKLALAKLVGWVARGIAMADRDNTADLEGDVFTHALEILPQYLKGSAQNIVPAHAWFKKAINRKFWELTGRDLMVRKLSQSIDSVDERTASATPVTFDRMAIVRSSKKSTSLVIQHEASAHNASRAIDHKIARAVRQFALSDDEHERYDMRMCVAALQGIRFDLVGEFKRIITEGIIYARQKRLHDITPPTRSPADFFGRDIGTDHEFKGVGAEEAYKLRVVLRELKPLPQSAALLASKSGVCRRNISRYVNILRANGFGVVVSGASRNRVYLLGGIVKPQPGETQMNGTTEAVGTTTTTPTAAPENPRPQHRKKSEAKAARLAALLGELSGGAQSVDKLAKKLGVNAVRIRRDVKQLRADGHPVEELGTTKNRSYRVAGDQSKPAPVKQAVKAVVDRGAPLGGAPITKAAAAVLTSGSNSRGGDLLRALAVVMDLCDAA